MPARCSAVFAVAAGVLLFFRFLVVHIAGGGGIGVDIAFSTVIRSRCIMAGSHDAGE